MNLFNGRISRVEVVEVIIDPDGTQRWFLDGRLHREDGPAITHPDGAQEFWENGNWIRAEPPGQPS